MDRGSRTGARRPRPHLGMGDRRGADRCRGSALPERCESGLHGATGLEQILERPAIGEPCGHMGVSVDYGRHSRDQSMCTRISGGQRRYRRGLSRRSLAGAGDRPALVGTIRSRRPCRSISTGTPVSSTWSSTRWTFARSFKAVSRVQGVWPWRLDLVSRLTSASRERRELDQRPPDPAGSGPSRTTILPVLSPEKRPRKAVTARSMPSTTVSWYLIRPALSQPPTSARNSG